MPTDPKLRMTAGKLRSPFFFFSLFSRSRREFEACIKQLLSYIAHDEEIRHDVLVGRISWGYSTGIKFWSFAVRHWTAGPFTNKCGVLTNHKLLLKIEKIPARSNVYCTTTKQVFWMLRQVFDIGQITCSHKRQSNLIVKQHPLFDRYINYIF